MIPAALVLRAATPSAAERMKDATSALAAMPNFNKASGAQTRGAGTALETALTGEKSSLVSAAADASPLGYSQGASSELGEVVKAKAEVIKKIRAEIAKVIVGQEEMIDLIVTRLVRTETRELRVM